MSYAMNRPPAYASHNAPAADLEAAHGYNDHIGYNPNFSETHIKDESQASASASATVNIYFQPEVVAVPPRENWKQWLPERTPGLVAWFTFFSLLSLGLTLAALFGCVSNATSNLHVASLQPYSILSSSKQYLLDKALPAFQNESNSTTIRDQDFFTHPLPYQYRIGIGGVCRLFNNTDLDDPLMTSTTVCTRHLHPQLDLLYLLAMDIPGGRSSQQYQNWESLLDQISPGFENSSAVAQRASLLFAASAFLVMSTAWVVFTLVATLLWSPMYPRWSMLSEIIEAGLMIGASIMWASVAAKVSTGYLSDGQYQIGVDGGPAYGILWSIGFAKLAVTPMMLYIMVKIFFKICEFTLKFLSACLSACRPRVVVVI